MISTVEIAVAPPKDTPRTDNNGRDLRNGYNLGRLNHDNIIPRETVRMTQRSTARTCARKDQSRDKTGEREIKKEKRKIGNQILYVRQLRQKYEEILS